MYSKNLSTKRISNDIKEIYKNPIEGIGIVSLDNDIMKYIVNIMLLSGPYKDYCLQLLLTFPDNYPVNPPKILIYPNQLFDNLYHHHVFPDNKKDENGNIFKKLCFDLLDNDFMSTKSEKTGWNPSYTISTLLMQVQSFLSDPDLSENSMPKPHQIEELMNSMSKYERIFKINEENGEIIKIHTWKDPYPKMYFKVNETLNKTDGLMLNDKNKLIKENLTCYITKLNIFDDPHIILGYPIVKKSSKIIYPIPEILSYEGYLTQTSYDYQEKSYLFEYERKNLKSANNEFYDAWLPIYINEANFEYNKQTILNSFSVLKYGNSGIKEYDFKPKYIFEILFKLLYQMITNMKDNKIYSAYLRAFFQYILLYKKLSKLYPIDMNEYFNVDLFYKNDIYSIICDFIILVLFDKFSFIENQLFKLKEVKKNKKAFEIFYENEGCDLKSPEEFLQNLEDNHLFSKIAEIMKFEKNLFLYNGKMSRKIKKIICTSFKKFINNSDANTREKLKEIIVENIHFYEYIEFENFFNNELDDESMTKRRKDILNNLIILLYIKKKINENNFMNELENNFSVYLDIDETIKKLNEIISNIDLYFDKEIKDLDKTICNRIKKIIEELLILDDKAKIETSYGFRLSRLSFFADFFDIFIDSPIYINSFNHFNRFNYIDFKFKIEPIASMKIDNLKLLYLYCYERLKKSINRKNNNLSLIESKFIEISLNDNDDDNCEWYNFICEKQEYYNENKKKFNYNEFVSENRHFISSFHKLVRLNEKLLLENFVINYPYFYSLPNISKYILKFNEQFLNKNVFWYMGIDFNLYFKEDDESIQKLKEIYDSGDITLLTFYELVLFECINKIDYGFLSVLKTQFLYDLQMKDNIKKLTEKKRPKMNRIYKIEKRLSKKMDNKISKFKRNKRDIFGVMKLNYRKTQIPIKVKKAKDYKQNNNYKH